MRWAFLLLAASVACSSAQHAHAAPSRSGWEDGVRAPERMEDFPEVQRAKMLPCPLDFESEDSEDWVGEYIDCVTTLGGEHPKCVCMDHWLHTSPPPWERQ